MQNNVQMGLLVNEAAALTKQVVDMVAGKVRQEKSSPREVCERLGVRYTPMSEELANLVLYKRKGRNGQEGKDVRLGDLGAFVLVKLVQGQIANDFAFQNLSKPVSLTVEVVESLAHLFNGKVTSASSKKV